MKRFAAHYLYFPGHGFLKQHVIEITDSTEINRIFALVDEMASVEWLPGVLIIDFGSVAGEDYIFDTSDILIELSENLLSEYVGKKINLFRVYPFSFTEMKPVSGTRFTKIY